MSLRVEDTITILLAAMLWVNVLSVNVVFAQQQEFTGREFYFHFKSQLYRNENSSIIGLEEANLSLPVRETSEVVEVAATIRNATTFFGTIWVGSVAWLTQPFAAPTVIQGELVFTVWLSSNDPIPSYSGVGAGVAVLDEKGHQVGNYAYSYSYAQGSILSSSPREYTFRVNFNQATNEGWKLVFAVGLGSTTAYWHMQVYFDSTTYPSRVQLPTSVTVIPEIDFSNLALSICTTFAFSVILLKRVRKIR